MFHKEAVSYMTNIKSQSEDSNTRKQVISTITKGIKACMKSIMARTRCLFGLPTDRNWDLGVNRWFIPCPAAKKLPE